MRAPVNRKPRLGVDGFGRWLQRLWPSHCLVCREAALLDRDLCAACADGLPWNRRACARCAVPLPAVGGVDDGAAAHDPLCGACLRRAPPVQRTHAACRYAAPLDRLLPRLKFHGDLAAGRLLAQMMADALREAEQPDALIAVPLHRSRLGERGYDQALELARPLARALGVPLLRGALLRTRATAPQSRLDAPQRRRNLHRAFRVAPGAALPAHVALVDDVMTTGATLHAAARVLRGAGVARVDAWVCARVPAPD